MDEYASGHAQDAARRREIAARVDYWMRRRGMNRQIFADRMGKSVSWVDKIKSGDRQLERLSVLRQIARVLEISLYVLIDETEAERAAQCPDAAEVVAITEALHHYDAITQVFRPTDEPLEEPDLARLERSVAYGWSAFQASTYSAVGQLLPTLLRRAQSAVWLLDRDDKAQALRLLTQTYQLTAAASFKLDQGHQLGWVAADRGIQVAEQTGDLTLIGSSARRVAHSLMAAGHGDRALALVTSATARLTPGLDDASPAFLSALGMLFLKGSIAAARTGQVALVRDLQEQAEEIALRLGDDRNEQWSAFGPTNVRLHRVSALADLREGGRVVEVAGSIDQGVLRALPRERRANHLLDVTRGYAQWGKRDEAVATLIDADQLAPEEVRCRRSVREIVTDLLRSYPRGTSPNPDLVRLASAIGVAA
jgi:transcriptional regulator with XRE-family HTH domain